MNCLFVYNNLSGGSKEVKYHDYIIKYLNSIYDEVDLFETCKGKDISTVLACKKYDDVICAGGDGSISLLINRLYELGYVCNIGYIPLGTANDFSRIHNIPRNVYKALKVIKNRNILEIKLGKANDKVMLYGLALGKISNVSYKANIANKKLLSKFSYILEGLKELFSLKKQEITLYIDDRKIEYTTPLILILASKSLGGFKVNYGKVNAYDVVILKQGLLNGLLGIISVFLFGYKKTNTLFYDYFNLQEFSVESKSSSWCLDGEKYESKHIDIKANEVNIHLIKKLDK